MIRHQLKKPACLDEVTAHFSNSNLNYNPNYVSSDNKDKDATLNTLRITDADRNNSPIKAPNIENIEITGSTAAGADTQAAVETDVRPHEICMIGDRALTDVMFANINGMRSVLVAPICT